MALQNFQYFHLLTIVIKKNLRTQILKSKLETGRVNNRMDFKDYIIGKEQIFGWVLSSLAVQRQGDHRN